MTESRDEVMEERTDSIAEPGSRSPMDTFNLTSAEQVESLNEGNRRAKQARGKSLSTR